MRDEEDLAEAAVDLEELMHRQLGPGAAVTAAVLEWDVVRYRPTVAGLLPMADVARAARYLNLGDEESDVAAVVMSGSTWCWPAHVWFSYFSYDMDPGECRRRAEIVTRREGVPDDHPGRVEVRWTVARDVEGHETAVVRVSGEARPAPTPWRGHYLLPWIPRDVSAHLGTALAER